MSNENLNDFYNQNRFNQKLRERIDGYEPELSDSLWDRIEHDLVRKESKGKRAVWMVYLLAGLLLMSGAGIYYLANENHKLAEKVKDNSSNNETLKGQETPSTVYTMPETTVNVEQPATNSGETAIEPNTNPLATPNPSRNPSVQQNPIAMVDQTPIATTPISEEPEVIDNSTSSTEANDNPSNILELSHEAMINPELALINGKELAPFALMPKTRFVNPIQENIINKGAINPKASLFVGLSSDLGSTRQLISGPPAARFHEHPFVYRSNGLDFGVLFRNGLYIQSGLRISITGSNLWYDREQSQLGDTIPGRSELDSIVPGGIHVVNSQNWTEIPLVVGYKYSLNSNWSVNTELGLKYSMINGYEGVEPNPNFQRMLQAGFIYGQPFQNYWSMRAGLGIGRTIGRNWMVDLSGNYQRGLTQMNRIREDSHPKRISEVLNGRISVKYIIR